MLGWLGSAVLTSIFGSWLVVKIFSIIFHDILGPATNAAKTGLFVGVGTAITTGLGLRGLKKTAQGLREANKEVGERIDPLPKDTQLK